MSLIPILFVSINFHRGTNCLPDIVVTVFTPRVSGLSPLIGQYSHPRILIGRHVSPDTRHRCQDKRQGHYSEIRKQVAPDNILTLILLVNTLHLKPILVHNITAIKISCIAIKYWDQICNLQ